MIQSFLKEELKEVIPELEWTIDFYTSQDNTGTVYAESGEAPDSYESGLRYPSYMVFIRSSDWTLARVAANKAFKHLHKKMKDLVLADGLQYQVFLIEAQSEPLRLGVQGDVMEYSINFQATIREV
jgi:hypothetical protein